MCAGLFLSAGRPPGFFLPDGFRLADGFRASVWRTASGFQESFRYSRILYPFSAADGYSSMTPLIISLSRFVSLIP